MEKLLLLKEIYFEAFKNWGSQFLKRYFKVLSWVCVFLIAVALYALIFRMSTGFAFV
ncbi:DUF6747 family protein [uncultured Maribacter sp.]|uniref:DUF6747 family protein n=1 Tax=uncultured Maribacter sp. TaxID=431308 RepID=UPI00261002B5|nr:DUF6747 family protein [uncultured Maribacter sp.]